MNQNKNLLFCREMNFQNKAMIGASGVFLLISVYIVLSGYTLPHINIHLPIIPLQVQVKFISYILICLISLAYFRGWKVSLITFFGLSFAAWLLECLSIHTGFPFGFYYYTSSFVNGGPKLFGTPVFLGPYHFACFFFPAYFISNLLVDGALFSPAKSWWKRTLFASFVGSLLVIGIDMLGDPQMVVVQKNWVWITKLLNDPYGIPITNYLGYLVEFLPVFMIFKYFEIKKNFRPMGPITLGVAVIPLAFQLIQLLEYMSTLPSEIFMTACFTIGLPLLLSADRLLALFRGKNTLN